MRHFLDSTMQAIALGGLVAAGFMLGIRFLNLQAYVAAQAPW